ncbi:MAG: EAL domain-containing protein [Cellulomonadaceae bacterium]|nr:EAL domain-containing protein [Cellulomonadaceae bacterium]
MGAADGLGGHDRVRALDESIEPIAIAAPVGDPGDGGVVDLEVVYLNGAARAWGSLVGVPLEVGTRLRGSSRFERYVDVLATGIPFVVDAAPAAAAHGGGDRAIDLRVARLGGELLLTWRDVTDRIAAEQALAASETRFRMAFDEAPVGMVVASLAPGHEAEYLEVNQALAELLGRTQADLVGRRGTELVHPDDIQVVQIMVDEMVAGSRSKYQREKRMRRADGTYVWVRMTATAVRREGRAAYALAHVEDITDRRAVEAELARNALYDSLTGLANRTLMLDHVQRAARDLGHVGGMLAVLYVDLDRFKDINDTLGHPAGDEVLREVARRLGTTLRAGETVGRLAGDEFVVAAPVPDDVHAVRVAERLVRAVSAPLLVGDRRLVVRPSVGVTTTADAGADAEMLVREADLAMNQARRRGSTPWALYEEALHTTALARLAVEEDLRTAIDHDGLRLLYQPIFDLTDGRLVSAEALLRLQHPTRGLLAPDAFIDVAEDSELILPIGAWVLAESCRQLSRWRRHRADMQVSVNVSARQVSRRAVNTEVERSSADAQVPMSQVMLEITERVLLGADAGVMSELLTVTGAGCGLAIDDFGTGYSSLTYLTRFPVTTLKIDRSFVSGLGRRQQDTAIVETVTGLASTLGLTTVAEGVETPEQMRALKAAGCHRAQGFYLARPMPARQLEELVRASA